jgi:hypothetical protein
MKYLYAQTDLFNRSWLAHLPGFYAGESYAFTLLYGKFRLHADKMKQLMTDIEQRHEKGPE